MRIIEDADAHAVPSQPTGSSEGSTAQDGAAAPTDSTASSQEPFCALTSSVGSELATWAAAQLDLALPLSSHTPHRPTITLGDDKGQLVVFSFDADGTLTPSACSPAPAASWW